MTSKDLHTFTVIYTCEQTLLLFNEVLHLPVCPIEKRVHIPESFKEGKIIIAVCEGDVSVLNTLGDRVFELA
jgi:uncharacterized protein (TIGR02922 family)